MSPLGFTASFAKQLEWRHVAVVPDGGPASCVADLYYWSCNRGQRFNWLASTNFEVFGR